MRTSSIRLRANARLAILHEDLLEICDGNMLAAMLLSILVYWHDIKVAKKDDNLWIWKSHQDFQEDLMFDKPGMKPPHRTTIKTALDLLLKKKFIQWRRNPKMPLDQTRQYLLDIKAVQKAIDALPPIVVKPTMQSQNSDNATSNNQQSLSENQQCNAEIPTSNTNDYSTEITDSEITEESTFGANAPARAHLKADIEEAMKSVDETLEVVEEETAKREAVKIGATHGVDRRSGPDDLLRGASGSSADAHSRADDARQGHVATAPVIPKRPPYRRPATQEKPQLTLEGANVKEWYEEKRGVKVRMIEKNIKDCNALGEYEEMTRESLHDTIEHLDKLKWVQEHDYAIDLHVLAGDGRLSFESNWPLIKRKRRGKSSTADEYGNDYSLTALTNRPSAFD